MDGIKVLEEVRQTEPDLKVIMISAFGSPSIKSAAKKLGTYKFLDKPFDLYRLVKVVKSALAKKSRGRLTAPHEGTVPRFADE